MKLTCPALTLVLLTSACGAPPTPPPPEPEDAGVDAGEGVDAGVGPLVLAVGDVAELTVTAGAAGAILATPAGTEKFVVILASTKIDGSRSSLGYSVGLSGAPSGATSKVVSGCSLSTDPWRGTVIPVETPPSGTGPAVGATKTINVPTNTGYEAITAQAIAVGTNAVVWADMTAAHPASLDAGFVTQFLTDFETTILPRERSVFGIESDQDGDGRIALVFSPLTYQTAVAFFTGCDLMSATECPEGNRGEYLYLTPPATIPPPYNSANAIKEILTHECSHLINYNRKVLKNALPSWPDSAYMDEGIGGFAQDAIGPQAGNLYVAKAGLDSINSFTLGDTLTDHTAYDKPRDGALRGGSYWFVRYLYDRAGGDTANVDGTLTNQGGPALMHALLSAPQSVAAALPTLTKASTADIATDFYTALAMSNRDEAGGVAPTNACFAFLPTAKDPIWNKQRGGSTFAKFTMQMTGPALQKADSADGQLRAGGVEYLELDAATGTPTIDLAIIVDPAALARVRVGRIR